jgi:hypothetical protein
MANYFGKRPIFVFSSLLLCVTFIWGANAQSFESLLWSNIVGAFAGSSTEALGAAIVNVSSHMISMFKNERHSHDALDMLIGFSGSVLLA